MRTNDNGENILYWRIRENEGSFEEPNPYLFPSAFKKEEEEFMGRVIEELVESKLNLIGAMKGNHNIHQIVL